MTRIHNRPLVRCAAPFLALCALVLVSLPGRADDTDLFTARVAPNVLLVIDTSGSMNIVVWHPAFRISAVYDPIGCPFVADPNDPAYDPDCLQYPLCNIVLNQAGFDGDGAGPLDVWSNNDLTFRTTNGRSGLTYCSNTRDLYTDPILQAEPTLTRWQLEYLKWYFSDNVEVDHDSNGQTILQEILSANNGVTSQCLLDQNPLKPATYSKYRRSRISAAREVLREVICQTSLVAELRYGMAKFSPTPSSDPTGGFVVVPIEDYTATHANLIETQINDLIGESWTPLAETMFNVYRYFQSRSSSPALQALGKDNVTRFPAYNLNLTGGTVGGTFTVQPVTDECQKHFVVLISDGEPTKDDFDGMAVSLATFQTNLIGDYNAPGDENELPPNYYFYPAMDGFSCGGSGAVTDTSCESSLYLDDITKYMHEKDFALDAAYPGVQTIDTYTVGFSTTPQANAVLLKAATVGGGEFYTSNNPEELADAITAALNSIVAKARSFTSAAVPASRTTNGDNFYSAYFVPVEDEPFWEGHLKDFEFSSAGDVLTSNGKCAVGLDPNVSPPCPTVGDLRTTALAFWDAATSMPDPADRKLYLEFGDTAMFAQPDTFTVPADPNDAVPWFGIVALDALVAPYSTLVPNTPADMATALIDTLRGCVFSSGSCTPRLDANGDPKYLGDIFHSSPVVVGSPAAPFNESSYKAFATSYRERTRVIYAGANDGFLHGFHAGDWQTLDTDGITPLSPPRHDRGTGEELMGFMPYGARNTVKELLKHQSGLRTQVNVDASPVAADVWFNRNVSGSNLTSVNPTAVAKQEAQWRTVLIQGLRDGGEHYSALDITDPPDSAADTTTSYPRYLWGFPCEDCVNAENGGTAGETTYMGLTWSEPVITRVRVKSESGSDPEGYERFVAVFGAGYHEHGDPNGSDYRVPTDAGFLPKGRAIYMVDITTGEVLARKYFDPAATALSSATGEQEGIREMRYAIPSAPAVFDLDFDGFADVIYIGDLGGNLWKWVVDEPGQDPIHNSTTDDDPAQPDWPFRLFFRGAASTEPPPEASGLAYDDTVHYQSFFFPPTALLKGSSVLLAFGAGERANPIGPAADWNDGVSTNNNHYYVVKDGDPLEGVGSLPNRLTGALVEADLADFDAPTPLTCSQMNATKQGYFITGRDAEKFLSNSFIFLGTLYTGSFLPNDPASTNVCDGAGTAFLYAFDVECGVGRFQSDPGTDQDKRRKAIGTGIPTRPRISVGDLNSGGAGGPCRNRVVVVTSDGRIVTDCGDEFDGSGVSIRSWRER